MLHKRLIQMRKEKKLTQLELAQQLDISRSRLSQYELGTRQPDNDMLNKLADFFDVTVDYLLGRTNQPNPNNNAASFDPLQELNKIFEKYDVQDAGFWDIEKWKEMTPEDFRSLEDYFEYLYNKSKNKQHKNDDHEEVDDI
ncbi:helix-turn-helix transcriptional regulator [Halobacillus kuroshimensis]|uniref:Helix-turn-helix transcriptional regulator n=1 Tax=Halobacillus kuroshimensis TaxID=302481 RepID=A0ABS3DZT6_9BACI|nr:helix-turn-helix transcriptional regulator [Halobacillus kuroshimensis]MBN8236862.1 helix-turn-helix transcriptional regulator [Halobacillus kuroshimensis]